MSAKISLELEKTLKERLLARDPLIQVLQGPRQVGKTTALLNLCKTLEKKLPTHYVSGDGVSTPLWIEEQWQSARLQGLILVIDEVQKIPQWSETVKKLWDESKRKKQSIKCILSGSSSLTLQKGLNETLTGRFEVIPAFHWGLELTQKLVNMSLDDYILYGGYPGSYQFIKDRKRWTQYLSSSIVETVIGKDILTQAQVKSPALFRQAFYLLSSLPAQVVSYNKLLGQLQDHGNIDLIKYYIELYESAFLIKAITKFTNNEIRKKSSSPKIIMMAPSLSTFHCLESLNNEFLGRVFESMVGAELIRQDFEVSYWQEGNYEVDYVLRYKRKLIAVEVKSGRKRKTKSLEIFLKKFPETQILFITKDNYHLFAKSIRDFLERIL